MKTQCGHKVLFGDIMWAMSGGLWDIITEEPTIVVIYMDKAVVNHQHGVEIDNSYFQVTRYDKGVPDGASLKLKKLQGELKDIIDEEIKANRKADDN